MSLIPRTRTDPAGDQGGMGRGTSPARSCVRAPPLCGRSTCPSPRWSVVRRASASNGHARPVGPFRARARAQAQSRPRRAARSRGTWRHELHGQVARVASHCVAAADDRAAARELLHVHELYAPVARVASRWVAATSAALGLLHGPGDALPLAGRSALGPRRAVRPSASQCGLLHLPTPRAARTSRARCEPVCLDSCRPRCRARTLARSRPALPCTARRAQPATRAPSVCRRSQAAPRVSPRAAVMPVVRRARLRVARSGPPGRAPDRRSPTASRRNACAGSRGRPGRSPRGSS